MVLNVSTGTARLHHQATTDGVEGVGGNTGDDGDDLGVEEHHGARGLLGIGEEDSLTSVKETEVGGAVSEDTNDGDTETLVETNGAVGGSNLLEAVDETGKLMSLSGADVSSESSTGEVDGVNNADGGCTSHTTGHAVTDEELAGLGLGVVGVKPLLVDILEGKVKGLGGEISDDVSHISSPESTNTLFVVNATEAVTNAGVLLHVGSSFTGLGGLLGHSILDLEEELDTLDGGDDGL